MNSEIVALRCPSCGSTDSINARELRFGYEFKCKHCGTASVLIINRELYVPRPGEHVCTACGRVAAAQARFCQCGASLVRKCIACRREFSADHSLCDYCGWPQNTPLQSSEAAAIYTERALADLKSGDSAKQNQAIYSLSKVAPPALVLEKLLPMIEGEWSTSAEQAWRTHVERDRSSALCLAAETLARRSNSPSEVLPALEALLRHPSCGSQDTVITAMGYCGAPAASILVSWLAGDDYGVAANALTKIGAEALPALKKVSGFFAPNPVKSRAKAIIKNIRKRST